ncbi:MAG: hypothetical protein KF688_06270 [Pirellulales bacterium]|nr:hypothetical protein [Pirellulales bacterium]
MRCTKLAGLALAATLLTAPVARAGEFTVSYLDGGSWSSVYAQGFSPSLGDTPSQSLGAGDAVSLRKFEFFKSGNADAAADFQLAILSNIFADLTGLSTGHGAFVGLSTNTIASTAGIATGDPIVFDFADLPLAYGGNYAAVLVTESAGALTPVLVSALTTNYVETPPGSGSYHPATNYGAEDQFQYATSNFIATNQFGSFFNTFSFAGDANFRATLFAVPEPETLAGAAVAATIAALFRRRLL